MLLLEGNHVINPSYNKRFGYTFIPMDEMKEISNSIDKKIGNFPTHPLYLDYMLKEWTYDNISLEQLIAVAVIYIVSSKKRSHYIHFDSKINNYSNLSLAIAHIICKTSRNRRNVIFQRLMMLGLNTQSCYFAHAIMYYLARVQPHISVEQRTYIREEMLYTSFNLGANPYVGSFNAVFECIKFREFRQDCTPEILCVYCKDLAVMKNLYNDYLKRVTLHRLLLNKDIRRTF